MVEEVLVEAGVLRVVGREAFFAFYVHFYEQMNGAAHGRFVGALL